MIMHYKLYAEKIQAILRKKKKKHAEIFLAHVLFLILAAKEIL